MINTKEFEVEMIRQDESLTSLCLFLDIAYPTLSKKKNEAGALFSKDEMEKLKDKWNLSNDRFCEIFFPIQCTNQTDMNEN